MFPRNQILLFLVVIVLVITAGCATSPETDNSSESQKTLVEPEANNEINGAVSSIPDDTDAEDDKMSAAATEFTNENEADDESVKEKDTDAKAENKVEGEQSDIQPDIQPLESIVFPKTPQPTAGTEPTEPYTLLLPYIPDKVEPEIVKREIPELVKKFARAIQLFTKGQKLLAEHIRAMQQAYTALLETRIEELETSSRLTAERNTKLQAQNEILEKEIFQMQEELIAALDNKTLVVNTGTRAEEPSPDSTGTDATESLGKEREDETKHVYAVPKDVIAVTLNGNGWIFLGEQSNTPGIDFKARDNTDKYTEFIYETRSLGEYFLQFRKQDLFTGEDLFQNVKVSVVTPEKFAEMLNFAKENATGLSPEITPSPKGFILADTLYNDEKYGEALDKYLLNYVEGNDRINQRIAELSFREGDFEQAQRFWEKNRYSDKETYREQAIEGLIQSAIKQNDGSLFDTLLPELNSLNRIPIQDLLKNMITFQIDREKLQSAAALLEEYVTRYYGKTGSDWAYFTLGTIHERTGPVRDLQKAKYYYRVVIQDFPASTYYDQAKERLQYINRNFINIR